MASAENWVGLIMAPLRLVMRNSAIITTNCQANRSWQWFVVNDLFCHTGCGRVTEYGVIEKSLANLFVRQP